MKITCNIRKEKIFLYRVKAMKNRMFKKVLTLMMAAVMLLGCFGLLAGCGEKDPFAGLTDAEYMKAVEKANTADAIDGLTEIYAALGKTDTKVETGAKVDYTITLGDTVIDMLEESYQQNVGSAMDFSFLSKIVMQMEMSAKDNLMKENLAVLLGDKEVVSAVLLIDMAKYVEYMLIPELNDDYIKIDMGEMLEGDITAANLAIRLPEIMAKLPSAKTLETLLNRYNDLVLDNLKDVTRSTVTLEKDDVKQECTAITVKINGTEAKTIAKAVLETAKADQDLKKVVDGLSELAGEDLYPNFQQSITDALNEVNKPDQASDFTDAIELVTYVDKEHNIIGRRLYSSETDEVLLMYYTITEGEKFAFKATVAGVGLTGTGTNKEGVINGSYTVSVGGVSYAFITVENLKATEKEMSGDITLRPSPALLGPINGNNLRFSDEALEIKLTNDSIQMKLMKKNDLLVGLDVKVKEATAGAIEMPSDAVDVNDSQALQNWLSAMDLQALLDNLQAAGVPGELIEMLQGGGVVG